MARDNALYIVDVYVPNEGEPESALELVIMRINTPQDRPKIHVHTYLQPQSYNLGRIRWNEVRFNGIKKEIFLDASWPSLNDIYDCDYLKDKRVVCFCSSLEPIQTLVSKCEDCYSILNMWQEVFAGDEHASGITSYVDMLGYMGLPVRDTSNTRYTPLMKRAQAQLAIWLYLFQCKRLNYRPLYGDSSLANNNFWPLQSVPEPWYTGEPKDLSEIPSPALLDYFSERLPDYIDWSNMLVYVHDWTFGREQRPEIKINNQDAMINFIFNNLFNLKTRLMVLAFYCLYNNRIEYARNIALHQGPFSKLQTSIKEDFASFVITHLDDFLSAPQKRDIIDALVEQGLLVKFERKEESFDFEDMRRHTQDGALNFYSEALKSNRNITWFKEITSASDTLYRCFVIEGTAQERNECIDHVNEKITSLLKEAQNPLADCWLSDDLRLWISSITGFNWKDLAREPRSNDSPTLSNTRSSICEIFSKRTKNYFGSYVKNFRNIIEEINKLPEGEKTTFVFTFMGITYEVCVDKREQANTLFGKLKRIFS